jgi:CheY-like chemotaxis protein
MHILVVEDDPIQAKFIRKALLESKELAHASLQRIPNEKYFHEWIKCIKTESAFRDAFENIATDKPGVIIIDMMLRWADPSPTIAPPPDEVEREGFYRAGLRCVKLLTTDERTKSIPVIFYSILEHEDFKNELPDNCVYLAKDFDKHNLIRAILEATSNHIARR